MGSKWKAEAAMVIISLLRRDRVQGYRLPIDEERLEMVVGYEDDCSRGERSPMDHEGELEGRALRKLREVWEVGR
jgi:hypothetical protein